MIAKTITYKDFNEQERTETFYFNLNKAEAIEMQVMEEGGLGAHIERIVEAQNAKEIIAVFKELILRSYGVKSADGRQFIKTKELSDAFSQTNAYAELFMQLASDADAGAAFVNGIMPQMTDEEIKKFTGEEPAKPLAVVKPAE